MMSVVPEAAPSWRRSLAAGLRIATARLRFFLLLGTVLAVVGFWPTLRNLWDKLTGPPGPGGRVSADTEYWCPMCPGVVSDWPGKCPVCHMALVLRQKGDMTPLPDGVVARMQFSPYRVQLAGIHTTPVEYRKLVREIVLAGLLEASTPADDITRLTLATDVFENDIGLFRIGQKVDLTSAAFPGQTFKARVVWLSPQVSASARSLGLRLEINNPDQELRRGLFVSGQVTVPLAGLATSRRHFLEKWSRRTGFGLCAASLASPSGLFPDSAGLETFLQLAGEYAALNQGLLLAVPESAVIDTGARKVVFLETSPGLFDAVEVQLGRRCGDFFPVLNGLEPGQEVVTAGAFLLDAATRLNPAAAASYFGAGSRGGAASATPTAPASMVGLSVEDQLLVKRQKLCPVTDQPLGSMGTPVRMVVEGRTLFLCCEHCAPAVKKDPKKYLAKLPK